MQGNDSRNDGELPNMVDRGADVYVISPAYASLRNEYTDAASAFSLGVPELGNLILRLLGCTSRLHF